MSINQQDDSGDTLLHLAVQAEDLIQVQSLLSQGANPSIQNIEENTPLHIAVHHLLPQFVQVLLKSGSNPNIKDSLGRSPMTLAFTMYQSLDKSQIALLNQIIKLLLKFGATPNTVNDFGHTYLNVAILLNELEIVKALLDAAANPNVEDLDGNNALIYAIYVGNEESAKILLKNGALNIQGNFLKTPLDWARFFNMDEITGILQGYPVYRRGEAPCITKIPNRSHTFTF